MAVYKCFGRVLWPDLGEALKHRLSKWQQEEVLIEAARRFWRPILVERHKKKKTG